MAPPRGERKKGKGAGGKTDLRPDRKQFKGHRKEDAAAERGDGDIERQQSAAPGSAALLAAASDEADFPRGGRSLLSKDEMTEARAEAEQDFEREGKKGKKRKRRGGDLSGFGAEGDMGTLFGGATTGKLPRFANRITVKNISPNMKLWGVVIEVNQNDIVLSLPGGIRGFVRSEDVCDIALQENHKDTENSLCAELVHVGQLVPCIVLRVDDDKKEGKVNRWVWLSLRLSLLYKGLSLDGLQEGMVLTAQVKSIEDHGYILHFGVSTFSGFMQKDDKENVKIECRQLIQCVVKAIDKTRAIVHLSSDEDLLSKSIIKDLKGLSIDHLIPGMMVNARVHSVLENGVMLSFLTYFSGTVDMFNLLNSFPSGNWKDDYSKNRKVNARILFVDRSTRAVGLTLNKHLLDLEVPPINLKAGDIYDKSKVLWVDKKAGLFLEIPSPTPSPGFISIHDVSDKDAKNLEKFKEGSSLRVRILEVRNLEGVAIGTVKVNLFRNMAINKLRKVLKTHKIKISGSQMILAERANQIDLNILHQGELFQLCKLNKISYLMTDTDLELRKKLQRAAASTQVIEFSTLEEKNNNNNEELWIAKKDGNCVPNSTHKYQEDQEVVLRQTPFEERLERLKKNYARSKS